MPGASKAGVKVAWGPGSAEYGVSICGQGQRSEVSCLWFLVRMSVIYFQILQHREGFNFQSCFPNQEPPEQGTAANMHTQEEARVSDATVVSTSVICISSDS